jgi:hypothetical protein
MVAIGARSGTVTLGPTETRSDTTPTNFRADRLLHRFQVYQHTVHKDRMDDEK